MKICAIVTSYQPNLDIFRRFNSLLSVCEHVFIVDNTPGGVSMTVPHEQYSIYSDGTNAGVGAALNDGILLAKNLGFEAAFLFDQDSSPSSEMVCLLVDTFINIRATSQHNICIGPRHIDVRSISEQDSCDECCAKCAGPISEVSCLPTSGMLIGLDGLDQDTMFSRDLFLDFVDFEWCWRIRRAGWKIFKINSAVMRHQLGMREDSLFGFRFSIPMPFRHYFLTRDSLYLLFRPGPPLYDRFRMLVFLFVRFVYFSLFVSPRIERFGWTLTGVRDYLKGEVGIGSAGKLLNKSSSGNTAS
jgi:rhamnosyltransferase